MLHKKPSAIRIGNLFRRGSLPIGLICLISTSASAQYAINTPILTSVDNFRDVAGIAAVYGGTGYSNTTSNNGVMRTGVYYRSNALTLNATDLKTVSKFGISQVLDLRTPFEIASKPDVIPEGAKWVNINILGSSNVTLTLTSPAASVSFMQGMNRAFVTDASERSQLRTVFLDLAQGNGAALFHCTAGKDRTGWVGAVLESIAGVSSATIMKDYLASNSYSAKSISATLSALPASYRAVYAPLLGVEASFLQAGLDQVVASYGSMNAYLTKGLGLTQADIYVLRAKMVEYLTLPGQTQLSGNAANGAALLNALQNSSLSGHYTAYNYYLQSAIDEGTLGGLETKVGGQVYADSAAYLLRQPQLIDDSVASYTVGSDLKEGETNVWLTGVAGYQGISGSQGISDSSNQSSGFILGATRRFTETSSAYLGVGQISNDVRSAGAKADVKDYVMVLGGRYGFTTLNAGPFVDAQLIAGSVDYKSTRDFGFGLGTASGKTNGNLVAGRVNIGDVIDFSSFKLTPQVGVRVVHSSLDSFNENGSELSMQMQSFSQTNTSALAELGFDLGEQQYSGWSLRPKAAIGFERLLITARPI
jgi:protein-tyrosine phosphatase